MDDHKPYLVADGGLSLDHVRHDAEKVLGQGFRRDVSVPADRGASRVRAHWQLTDAQALLPRLAWRE